jgi:hypothetical protein
MMTKYAKQLQRQLRTVPEPSPSIHVLSAVLGMAGEEIGVFAKDIVALRQAWYKLAGEDIPLDESRVQRIAIFSQDHTDARPTPTSLAAQSEKP